MYSFFCVLLEKSRGILLRLLDPRFLGGMVKVYLVTIMMSYVILLL